MHVLVYRYVLNQGLTNTAVNMGTKREGPKVRNLRAWKMKSGSKDQWLCYCENC